MFGKKMSNLESLSDPKASDIRNYSLTCFEEKVIIRSGGQFLRPRQLDTNPEAERVEAYLIDEDKWIQVAETHFKHKMHSSCILGGRVFIFSGDYDDAIEFADVEELL